MKHGCVLKKENMMIFQKNVMSFLSTRKLLSIMKYRVSSLTRFAEFVYLYQLFSVETNFVRIALFVMAFL